jgi:hypothetical protein
MTPLTRSHTDTQVGGGAAWAHMAAFPRMSAGVCDRAGEEVVRSDGTVVVRSTLVE